MANIQILQGKRGKTYRVQFNSIGKRVTKTFKTRKAADEYNATLQLNSNTFFTLSDEALNTHTIETAINYYLEQHTGKDKCVPMRLN